MKIGEIVVMAFLYIGVILMVLGIISDDWEGVILGFQSVILSTLIEIKMDLRNKTE